MQPHLARLGRLVGDRLDDLAREADKTPPRLEPRTRAGRGPPEHRQGAGLPRHGAHRLRRVGAGRAFAPAGARLEEAAVGRQQIRAHLPVRPVGVRPAVPGQHDRQPHAHHPPLRRRDAAGALPAGAACRGRRRAAAGRHVHDGALRRLRRRRHRDARRALSATTGGSTATSGSAPTPTPIWPWSWRGPRVRRRARPASACS